MANTAMSMIGSPAALNAAEAAGITPRIARYLLPEVLPLVLDIGRSRENHLFDSVSQRLLLDCYSFIASNPLGYNHPKLDEPEFEKKLLRAAKCKVANSDLHTPELAEFVDTFARIAVPPQFTHLFFVEGGAQAVENALKTAFDWKVRLNLGRKPGSERGGQVLHFREAFHGRSGYALSLTNTDANKTKYYPKFDWPRIPSPKIRFPLRDHVEEVAAQEDQSLALIEQAFRERPDEIAAIIIEPIQGEGGDNHFRPRFHQALRALADAHEAMLIYDEVQTGLGLTGKLWAYQHFDMRPDIVVFGKKTQVCGIMVGPRVDLAQDNVFREKSRINSTWGGSLVDMVRCQRYLEIITEDGLVDNAARVGNELLDALLDVQGRHPHALSNARGRGLMCAVDLPDTDARTTMLAKILEMGAVLLPCGRRSLRLRPSLTFTSANVAELAEILDSAIKALYGTRHHLPPAAARSHPDRLDAPIQNASARGRNDPLSHDSAAHRAVP